MKVQVYIEGVGVWSPGLEGWSQARAVLAGETGFDPAPASLPAAALLSAAERRRSPATAKLAVQVAAEACAMAGSDPARLPSIFTSSHGDTEITDYMCRELSANAAVSPTRFHNSVHNAASGYWTIAAHAMESSIAISAGERSFGYGLLEAAAQAVTSASPVLLVAYDHAAPAPLSGVCAISRTFAVALVLSPSASVRSLATLRLLADTDSSHETGPLSQELLDLIRGNPAARSLLLLSCLARNESTGFDLPPYRWELLPRK